MKALANQLWEIVRRHAGRTRDGAWISTIALKYSFYALPRSLEILGHCLSPLLLSCNVLGREASKKLVRSVDLSLPYFQSESYIRAVVSPGSISYQPLASHRALSQLLDSPRKTPARKFT